MSESSSLDLANRIENCLALGALGDWLGSGIEGAPLASRRLDRRAGGLTDDTILTLATARAIASSGRVDPEQVAVHRLDAFRSGVPGIGSSTLGAMKALAAGQHWALSGIAGDRAGGNGAAMRIAPLAFVLDPSDDGARQLILDTARITHRNDEAVTGALALTIGIRLALEGRTDRSSSLSCVAEMLPDTRVRDAIVVASNFGSKSAQAAADALGSSGHVSESVPLALYLGFDKCESAVDHIETAAVASEDADTVGSMVGQLLGAAGHHLPAASPVRQHLPDDLGELSRTIAEGSDFLE